jgi:predicted nucleic-acid-binding protein
VRGIDTNVLLRFFKDDDLDQFETVRDLFQRAEAEDGRFHVSSTVLVELVWVLRSRYRIRRDEICSILDQLLRARILQIQDRDLARRAVEEFRRGPADFADYLIGWQNRQAGCEETLSFDQGLDGAPGFVILS